MTVSMLCNVGCLELTIASDGQESVVGVLMAISLRRTKWLSLSVERKCSESSNPCIHLYL